jgi:CRP-like cAMP-binding protein
MHRPPALANVPLFRRLPETDLLRLGRGVRRRNFKTGETIFLRGDDGRSLYVVESGRVKLSLTSEYHGREVALALLHPGEVFGELSLLDGEPRSADAFAVGPTVLLLLEREEFLNFLREHPQAAIDLLADMANRMRRDAHRIEEAAFLDVPGRLARVILREAKVQSDGTRATGKLTQTQIAELAQTTRETLNKHLGEFTGLGLIELADGCVRVVDVAGLEKRAT